MSPEAALLAAARHELTAWEAPDAEQADLRSTYLSRLDRDGAAATLKDGPGGEHLTASCVAFDPTASRVLLTLHRKGGFWVQFGGHLELGDGGIAAAAQRELREESGVPDATLLSSVPFQLHRHGLADTFGDCRIHLDVVFVALLDEHARPVVCDESLDVAWFDLDGLPAGTVPDLPARLAVLAERVRALSSAEQQGDVSR